VEDGKAAKSRRFLYDPDDLRRSGMGDWRRGRDSNPRSPARGTTVFETAPFDRSGTSPSERGQGLTTRLPRTSSERNGNWHPIGTGRFFSAAWAHRRLERVFEQEMSGPEIFRGRQFRIADLTIAARRGGLAFDEGRGGPARTARRRLALGAGRRRPSRSIAGPSGILRDHGHFTPRLSATERRFLIVSAKL
jgi:hypothetical protein